MANYLNNRSQKTLNQDQYFNLVKDIDRLNNIVFDPSVFTVIEDNSGIYISLEQDTSITTRKQIFDILELGSNSFAITVWGLPAVSILGQDVALEAGSGFSAEWSSEYNTDIYVSSNNSASNYIYVELDRANISASINRGDVIPAGTDIQEYKPLYCITANVSSLDTTEIIDMRSHISMDGMS